eukprot:1020683-Rhodomonas_salina.1
MAGHPREVVAPQCTVQAAIVSGLHRGNAGPTPEKHAFPGNNPLTDLELRQIRRTERAHMDTDDVISDSAARKPLQKLSEPPSQLDLGCVPCREVIVRSLNVSPDLKTDKSALPRKPPTFECADPAATTTLPHPSRIVSCSKRLSCQCKMP